MYKNFREMAKHNSNIKKLDESEKLPKQPYCVGCENKVDDWDVYVDLIEDGSIHAVCPYCGLLNYEDSKHLPGCIVVLVFCITIPFFIATGIAYVFGVSAEGDGWEIEGIFVASFILGFLLYIALWQFRVSDLSKKMKAIEQKKNPDQSQ